MKNTSCNNCRHWMPDVSGVTGFCPVFGKGTKLPHGESCTAWQIEHKELLIQIHMLLEHLSEESRVEFFRTVTCGYCEHCGRKLVQYPNGSIQYCYCTRDE